MPTTISVNPDVRQKPPSIEGNGLADLYFQWFSSSIADTPEQIKQAHRLRYDVYCEETGFEPKEDNPGKQERDPFDEHSAHAVLTHLPTNTVAGTLRIVLPVPDKPGADLPARMASSLLDELPFLPRESTGEISRFTVAREFRKRQQDTLYASVYNDEQDRSRDPRRILPHIALGLLQSVFEITLRHNLTHLCAVIDPALLRLVRRLGLEFHKVGDLIEFHGMRQPIYCDNREILETVHKKRREVWEVITCRHQDILDGLY